MADTVSSSSHPLLPPTSEDDRLGWLRLLRSHRVGVSTFYRLMAEHGTAEAALAALPDVARAAGIDRYTPCSTADAEGEYRRGKAIGARLICRGEAEYPAALAQLADAPPFLWARGRVEQAAEMHVKYDHDYRNRAEAPARPGTPRERLGPVWAV